MADIAPRKGSILQEASGACGDLGTFIPHVIGAITVAGLAPSGVLSGFGIFLIATGVFYGLPLPVQPMKAVSAVILTGGLRPGEVAAAGVMIGAVLLLLAITGLIGRLARVIPQSVGAGLRLGLGLLMGVLGLKLMLETPWIGFLALGSLVLLTRIPRCPGAPIVLGAAALVGWMTAGAAIPAEAPIAPSGLRLVIPTWAEVWRSLQIAVLPQLSLTLTNAVIVTASLSRELFPETGAIASERNLALSSRRRWSAGAIPLWRTNRVGADHPGDRSPLTRDRVCRSCRCAARDHPDERRRRAADPGRSRLGDFAPAVRWQAVVLVGYRCHRPRHRDHQPGSGAGLRMDHRIRPGGNRR